MEINVDQELLDEVNIFLPDLITYMKLHGVDFYVMAFITQSIVSAIDNAQEALDNQDNL
jgi:hypothetical protein